MLGAATLVPLILLAGPLAGYLLSHYLLVKQFGLPDFLIPLFVGLGLVASGTKIYQIIKEIQKSDSNK